MSVSHCLENYLSVAHVDYALVPHSPTVSAFDSACSARLAASEVVKAVVLKDRAADGYTMALIPACNKLEMSRLPHVHGEMCLATEDEFESLFPDCELGAVPGFGQAFHVDMIWDEELLAAQNLYFEAGDHQALIQIQQDEFRQLFGQYPHALISVPRAEQYISW
jgi:Ala-tRNA(Pro) deacylase